MSKYKTSEAVKKYHRERKRKLRLTEEGRKILNAAQDRYRKKMKTLGLWKQVRGNRTIQARRWLAKPENNIKKIAHIKVWEAKKKGILIKKPCEYCGNEKVNAHHDDYSKPLEVRWLCGLHHYQWHKGLLKRTSQLKSQDVVQVTA